MPAKRRAVTYIRTSTDEQHTDVQTHDLRRYIDERGFALKGEYVDEGVSSGKKSRPQLEAMMKRVRRGGVDAVIVWRFDRFARSTRELATALEEFDDRGIDFVSIHEGIDTSTPGGKLAFHVFAAVAEFEKSLIVMRVKAGVEAARRRGKTLGRPCRDDLDVDEVHRLRSKGWGWRRVAKEMGFPMSTVRDRFIKAFGIPPAGETH